MTDADPQLRKVVFELPNEHIPELLSALGDFALEHNISLDVGEADPQTVQPAITVEQQKYNPDLVTWIEDPESQEDVAVIARDNLQDFAEIRDGHPTLGTRFYVSLLNGPEWRSAMSRRAEWESIRIYDNDDNFAIRAEYARDLLEHLQKPTLAFRRLGKGQIEFFAQYCEELHTEDAPAD